MQRVSDGRESNISGPRGAVTVSSLVRSTSDIARVARILTPLLIRQVTSLV